MQSTSIELQKAPQPTTVYQEVPKAATSQKAGGEKRSLFSHLHFFWMFKVASKANNLLNKNKSLTHNDLDNLPWKDRPDVLEEKITQSLQNNKKQKSTKKASVTLAVLGAVKWPLILWILIHIAFMLLRVFTVWVVKMLIESYSNPSKSEAYKWSGILCAVLVATFYCEHHYNYLSYLVPTHIKSSIISLLFSKVTRLSAYSLNQISLGKLTNLVVSDLSVFELSANYSTNAITSVVGIGAGIGVLWTFFGAYCLIGVGFIVFSVPLQHIFNSLTSKPKNDKTGFTDQRIKLTSEVIEGIRLLKMYAWEMRFKDMIEVIRKQEIRMITKIMLWEGIERGLTFGAHVIALFLMLLAYVFTDHELKTSTVFPAYFLFAMMRNYICFYATLALNFFFDAKIVMQRLQSVMDFPEAEETLSEEPRDSNNAVEFDNFTGYWRVNNVDASQGNNKTDHDNAGLINSEAKPTLVNIDMNIKKGSLNALIGTVGAGKSSFLLSLTGEMPKTTGSLRKRGTTAYAEQEPTIFAGTFRENVLFGKPFEPEFYNKVIKACNLENDLKLFANGDMSEIGEKGNNLSGGQRARLGLARAVYADADIYLLDDPLSAVDAKVAKSLVNDAIMTMLRDKTVILATHQVHFVKDFESIIVLEDGHALGKGTYAELKQMNVDVDRIFNSTSDKDGQSKKASADEEVIPVLPTEKAALLPTDQIETQKETQKPKQNVAQESYFSAEDPYAGKVNRHTYKCFIDEMGGVCMLLLILSSFVISEMANVGYMRILGGWTEDEFNQTQGLSIVGGFAIFINVMYVLRTVFISLMLIRVGKRLQEKALYTVIRNPVQFFDTNPLGRIISRFSNDVGVLDSFLPVVSMNVIDYAGDIICMALALSIINPILIAPIAFIFIGAALITKFSYESVKQTKDCDLDTRDPVNNLFSASLSGMTIIKTYSQETNFKQRFTDLLIKNTKACVAFCDASSFFGFYVDMIFYMGAVAIIFIITARATDPALASLCIVALCAVTGALPVCLRQLIQFNVLMSSVERLRTYTKIQSEAPTVLSKDEEYKKLGWPKNGDIDFHKVYMKYRPDAEYVIKDLNLHANPGEKIGCIGRTGAGKSSIIQLLFRLVEIDRTGSDKADSHIKIDDVNIQTLGLHLLRNNISIIPQVPFIFSGTVKMNIDPTGKFSDEQIWKVLEDVNLKSHVEKLDRQLYFEIGGNTPAFSVGQKQLICLARTILNPSSLLVLDEATANMDQQTDMFIQEKIMEKFASSTVFTIAHRLSTIANYDKVLVLDKGRKVEFEAPYRLLVKEIGDDDITNPTGHFGSMVLNTGPKAARHIFELAKATYFSKRQINKQVNGGYMKL